MSFYNLWCKHEARYKLHNVINKGKKQIIHCVSCGLIKTNIRLSEHASISDFLLKKNLNNNWGKRKQQQLLKQETIEQRKEKVKKIKRETRGTIIWLKKSLQKIW